MKLLNNRSSNVAVSLVAGAKRDRRDLQRRPISCLQLGCGWFTEQPGGLERYYRDLLLALPNVDVECRGLVIGSDLVARETNDRVHGFAEHSEGLRGRWRGMRASHQREQIYNAELLVAHFACYLYPILSELRNRPVVVHFHGPWAAEGRQEGGKALNVWLKSRLEAKVYRRADRLITLSAAYRDLLCRDYKVNPENIRVVPGGVNTAIYRDAAQLTRQAAREKLGWPQNRPIILTVRRLLARMGLENLLQAIHEVRLKHPDVLCLIGGRGRMQETLEHQVSALGLSNNVKLLGFLHDDDLPIAYRAADFTIMPSVSLEGFGLSAVESLAAGTPVLVTPVGGLPEVVSKLDQRLVLPGYDTASLVEGISMALRDRSALPGSIACREYAFEEFDWSKIVEQIRSVYEEVL